MLRLDQLFTGVALVALATACGDDDSDTPDIGMPDSGVVDMGKPDTGAPDMGGTLGTIVDVATEAGLTDLLGAAMTADLADTLQSPGPFTVFAPTNAAFAMLGDAVPTNPDLLANVLLHHVVPGTNDSAAVLGATSFTTVANTSLAVDAMAGTIGGAALSDTLNVPASNGIVHVIDAVMVPPRIDEAVAATLDLSTLGTAVGAASMDVQNTLSGSGPITVFAPVNAAFTGIDLNALTPAQIDNILTYHVVPEQTLRAGLVDGDTLTTAQGSALTVTVSGDNITLTDVSGATVNVLTTDIRLLNGVVHLIDGVLDPVPPVTDNLVQAAQGAGLNGLVGIASGLGLGPTLSTEGPFTLFGPTNAALLAAQASLPMENELVTNILLNHVISGTQSSEAVLGATTFTTLANTTITVDAGASPPTIGGAALNPTNLDIPATNGVLHVLDAVIIPPTVAEAAAALPNLSTLNAAIAAADPAVVTTVAGPAPITVFAPVDAAFTGVDVGALVADQPRLTDILQYHVATGQTLSTDLINGQVVTMANGLTLTVNIDGAGNVSLTDGLGLNANVIQADIRLLNGTVHLIDGILNPGNVVERGTAAGLTSLVDAINRVGLDGALRGIGPFTVFAPTNAAFTNLGVNLMDVDDAVLANILLHHVVGGRNDSAAVLGATSFTTLANTSLAINAGPPITIGGSNLSTTLDVAANNGIVHLMDQVIVPPTITEAAGTVPSLSRVITALGRASAITQAAVAPSTLTGDAPITVFAPANSAFANQMIDETTAPQAVLDLLLAYHAIPSQVLGADVPTTPTSIMTLGGLSFTIQRSGTTITITDNTGGVGTVDANLRDIRTLGGVVHVVDRVLQPQ
ncbi:MAG: fasciclin domain-containing protein [Myxococcota bacterium]